MYTFDRVTVSLESREVALGGQRQPLSTRAFDILELLISARGRLVTKDEIMRAVWPRTFVIDNNIHVHICELRKLFGGKQGWIRTESGRGYRLAPPERHPHPMPAAPATRDTLIGRERELTNLHALVDSDVLVTLTGAPGVGKSTLARELARERACIGDTPTVFVELADAPPGTTMAGALGAALALPLPHDLPAIVAAVARRPALIVLDGCDAFVDEAASLCQALATGCAGVHVVATSREPLHIAAERTWRVPPLAVPALAATHAEVAASPAVRLFMARMGAPAGHAPVPTGALDPVASLCRRAGGNPLLLELIAARAAALGVSCVLEQSDAQWLALANVMRDVPARHRSLAEAYASSCARLTPQERRVLAGLATLSGTFAIDAARAIAPQCGLDGEALLDVLAALVAKSLVDVEATPTAAARRYRISSTLRAFACDMPLGETCPAEAGMQQHADDPDRDIALPPPAGSGGHAAHRLAALDAPPGGHVWRSVPPLDTSRSVVPVLAVPTARGAPVPRRGRAPAGKPVHAGQATACNGQDTAATRRQAPRSAHLSPGRRRARREPS